MSEYVDHGRGCPKCKSEELALIGHGYQWSEVYWEKYRCESCGYEFVDEFWYHHSYDKEGEDEKS
jgi:transposase-like protein